MRAATVGSYVRCTASGNANFMRIHGLDSATPSPARCFARALQHYAIKSSDECERTRPLRLSLRWTTFRVPTRRRDCEPVYEDRNKGEASFDVYEISRHSIVA